MSKLVDSSGKWSWVLMGSLSTYVAGLLIWLIGRNVFGDGSIYVLSLNYLGPWLFFPLLVFIPWVLVTRQKFGAVTLIIPAALFLWFYGALFLPKVTQDASSQHIITVMSFNIQEIPIDIDRFGWLLRSYPSDILALQEVSGLSTRELNDMLSESHPYQAYDLATGLAIYSRYPILDYQIYYAQSWSFQSIIVDTGNVSLHIINTHLARTGLLISLNSSKVEPVIDLAIIRSNQITQIKKVISDVNLLAIVACDCNMTDLTATYSQITDKLQDAYRQRGWGFGHTFLIPRGFEIKSKVNVPFQRIDYLFYSQGLGVKKIKVVSEDMGSDHRPIWGQFNLGVDHIGMSDD